MKKLVIFVILFFSSPMVIAPSFGNGRWGEHQQWMGLISDNCEPTLSGRVKRLWDERYFWVEVNVAMQMWAESMASANYQNYCIEMYAQEPERRFRCVASVRSNFDWHRRCRPFVVSMCRQAGGRCN